METFIEQLSIESQQLRRLLQKLILEHSSIEDRFKSSSFVGISLSPFGWKELDLEGKQLQSRLFKQYQHFLARVSILLIGQPKKILDDYQNCKSILDPIVEQEPTWINNTQEALSESVSALEKLIELLNQIYGSSNDRIIIVPDTNALLTAPCLVDWAVPDVSKFEVVLLPTVLSELDALKINHKNERVRDKAGSIIRQIKGFRARGRLSDSVTLKANLSTLRAIAVEPNFDHTFPWLDRENNDDRLLASFIEVLRLHPHSCVMLVTADINMQNKAEYAGIPYIEPPQLPISS